MPIENSLVEMKTCLEIFNLMKKNILTLIISLFYLYGISQSNLDSLSNIREDLINEKNQIESQIEEIEKKIITDILTNGYEMTIKGSYRGQTFDLKLLDKTPQTTLSLTDGDKIIVIGMESIYYKVKFGENIGLIFLSNPEFPISLLKEHKYKDHIDGKDRNKKSITSSGSNGTSKSSSSTCYSTQCSGHTQKGTRCRNMTTNCNGKCHLH